MKPTLKIPGREQELLDLQGDGSKLVKVTYAAEPRLSGWYLFQRADSSNRFARSQFIRKAPDSDLVQILSSEIKYLHFDPKMGVVPDHFHCDYIPLRPGSEGYASLQQGLQAADHWQ